MSAEYAALYLTAAIIAVSHTLLGPDHYIPFIAMARVRDWTTRRTLVITTLCGIGHVLSSVLLGLVGIALGVLVFRLERIEEFRGDVAGWLLIAFGMIYTMWGVKQALRHRSHTHLHVHNDGTVHAHEHAHQADHLHPHESMIDAPPPQAHHQDVQSLTPWVLFTIFLFGPCEPLIPLLMYPAALGGWLHVAAVAFIFGVTTVATMVGVVYLACRRAARPFSDAHSRLGRFAHVAGGLVVLSCGIAVKAGL